MFVMRDFFVAMLMFEISLDSVLSVNVVGMNVFIPP